MQGTKTEKTESSELESSTLLMHLNDMSVNKHALLQFQSDIASFVNAFSQKKIQAISPKWIESLQYFERNNKLLVAIKLASRPATGEIPAFQRKFIELAGTQVEFAYSAGRRLQDSKIKVAEPVPLKSELTDKISKSLPENMQLTNLWIYSPKVGNKSHPILLCQIMSDERQDSLLRSWQEKFEEEHEIDILIKRDWVKPALERMLSKFLGHDNELIQASDLPAIKKLKKHFFGSNKNFKVRAYDKYLNEENLKDFTSDEYLWVTPDDPETQDREDQFCAKRLATGEIEIYISVIDPSIHVKPNNREEKYAAKIGQTHYMRGGHLATLPGSIPYYHASFLPDKERRAIVLRYTFDENARGLIKKPEFFWANTISQGNVAPALISDILQGNISANNMRSMLKQSATYETAIRVRGSLFLLTECLPALKAHIRGQGSLANPQINMRRLKASGLGGDLVTTAMIAIKSELAKYLHGSGVKFIASNQHYPDQQYLNDLSETLKNKGINLIGNEFTNEFSFKELLQYLDRQKEYALFNEIISKYLLKTTLSIKSTGFQALSVPHYLNIKPREYDGLINNMIAVAHLAGNPPPFSDAEIEKRIHIARKRRRQYDSMGYLYRILSSIERRAKNIGQIYAAEKIGTEGQYTEIKVSSFRHTCLMLSNKSDSVKDGKNLLVRFLGLNYKKLNAYMFEELE